ncbi:MAG: MFS transporter [Clostridia bacterium]|nr:MFS transporter [Clostridia bacterium]
MNKFKALKGKLFYGTGAIGLDLSYGLFYNYLAKYMTDILHLNKRFLLLLTPIARIWDGINDPMMGAIVDNTNTKYGRYKPWVMFGSITNAIVLSLIFFTPSFFNLNGGIGIYIFIAAMYVLWGMTNTTADIPYWSMVPSFTSDPKERNTLATIARTFSGLGQGIITIASPLVYSLLSRTVDTDGNKVYDVNSYRWWAVICAAMLVFFSALSMSKIKEVNHTKSEEKFSFKRIFKIIKDNDQLRVFMLFAAISNTGWYMISGVGAYYFDVVAGNANKQSMFNTFGAVGSILGLLVIPVMTKFTTKRRTYQTSLAMGFVGFALMGVGGALLGSDILMYIGYLIGSTGIASMFISQTIFLADIVDYGEVKMGYRAESGTFSMKGFLQKMAYTIETVILFAGLEITHYNENLHAQNSASVKNAISAMMFIVPAVCILLSLIIYSVRFKLHGAFMDSVTAEVTKRREEREAAAAKG